MTGPKYANNVKVGAVLLRKRNNVHDEEVEGYDSNSDLE